MLAEGGQTPLEAEVVVLQVLVLDVVLVLLVDRVVGQMHVLVVLRELVRVLFTSKPG